jgi:MFS-type transporter involved in bile tolerance (Atg22 family)
MTSTLDSPVESRGTKDTAHQKARYWYDWANSAYVTTTQTVLMGPYLTVDSTKVWDCSLPFAEVVIKRRCGSASGPSRSTQPSGSGAWRVATAASHPSVAAMSSKAGRRGRFVSVPASRARACPRPYSVAWTSTFWAL